MAIVILSSALWHGVTPEEIRQVVEHLRVRNRLTSRRFADAEPFRCIGDPSVWIETLVDERGEDRVVFHAMVLRMRVAEEFLRYSGNDYRHELTGQREYAGPQGGNRR